MGTVSEQMGQGSLGPGPAGAALSPCPSAGSSLSPRRGPSPRGVHCALGVDLWARSGCAFAPAVITGGPGLQTRPERRLRSVPGVAARPSPGPLLPALLPLRQGTLRSPHLLPSDGLRAPRLSLTSCVATDTCTPHAGRGLPTGGGETPPGPGSHLDFSGPSILCSPTATAPAFTWGHRCPLPQPLQ